MEIENSKNIVEDDHHHYDGNNSLSSSSSSIASSSSRSNSKSPDISQTDDEKTLIKSFNNQKLQANEDEDTDLGSKSTFQTQRLRRSNIKNIIRSLYKMNNEQLQLNDDDLDPATLIEDYLDMLPNGKSQKNSILLTWKKRYFKLHLGSIYIYEDNQMYNNNKTPLNVYNLMGGKIEYEDNRVICVDDSRGSYLVVRCYDDIQYSKWKNAFELQIVDRIHSLWIKPKFSENSENKIVSSDKVSFFACFKFSKEFI